jgi:hypothetical protein
MSNFDYAIVDDLVQTAKPSKPFPKVGDTLTIKHQVKRTNGGEVLGMHRADGKGYATKITAVFMDGSVRTGNSDTWEVKPGTQGHWETVNPSHVDREAR